MLVAPTPGRQSAVTFDRALDWLTANRDVRSFAFVHTYEVHTPYLPPEELADAFASGPAGLAPHPGLKPKQSPELYDREILHLDRQLEAFVEGLRERGLLGSDPPRRQRRRASRQPGCVW